MFSVSFLGVLRDSVVKIDSSRWEFPGGFFCAKRKKLDADQTDLADQRGYLFDHNESAAIRVIRALFFTPQQIAVSLCVQNCAQVVQIRTDLIFYVGKPLFIRPNSTSNLTLRTLRGAME